MGPSSKFLIEAGIAEARAIIILRPSSEGKVNLQNRHGFILQCYEAVRYCLHEMPMVNQRDIEERPFIICEASNMTTMLGLEYLSNAGKKISRTGQTSLSNNSHIFISFFAAGHCTSGSFADSLFGQATQETGEFSIYEIVKHLLKHPIHPQ